jgi:hypothetical protein
MLPTTSSLGPVSKMPSQPTLAARSRNFARTAGRSSSDMPLSCCASIRPTSTMGRSGFEPVNTSTSPGARGCIGRGGLLSGV